MSGKFCGGIVAQVLHDAGHLVHAGQTGEFIGIHLVQVAAVLCVNLFQTLFDGAADAAVIRRHLADEHGCDHGVLVADIGSGQVSVAFLKTEDEAVGFSRCFQTGDLVADPLESGEDAAQLYAVMGGHCVRQWCGDDGFDSYRTLRHGAFFYPSCADII